MEEQKLEWLDVSAGEDGDDEEFLLKSTRSVPAKAERKLGGSGVSFAGPMLAQFSVYAYRFLLLPWLWRGEGLQLFIPVLSPVYRQAEHWQAKAETRAIVLHIVSGSVLLVLGLAQFDKGIRQTYPRFHRWSGRAYTACGLVCLYYLRQLRGSAGAGSAPGGHSDALVLFIDASSALWVLATGAAVGCAIKRNFLLHRDLMACSLAMASVPIAQRTISWFFLAPLSMVLRLLICLFAGFSPWRAEFGPPGSMASTVLGHCAAADRAQDPRACPAVLSVDGYGEAEQSSFSVSAWLGFAAVLAFGLPRLLAHVRGSVSESTETGKHDPNADLSDLYLFDVWRTVLPALQAALSLLQDQAASTVASIGWGGRCATHCVVAVVLPVFTVLGVLGTFTTLVVVTMFVAMIYVLFLFIPIYIGYMLLRML
jgi:hypothetical protein